MIIQTGVLDENDATIIQNHTNLVFKKQEYKHEIIWSNVFYYALIHIFGICGLFLITSIKIPTILLGILLYHVSVIGTMAGTHRLWSHRSYKAKWQLKLILIIFTTIAYQKSTFEWARDHRVHHKYSDTDADPHNSKRGFFFSHVGWMFVKKLPEMIEKGKKIDVSDLYADPFVSFQSRYYWIMPVVSFILPVVISMVLWNETLLNAHCMNMLRYSLSINSAFSINSFAHLYGNQRYDRFIQPRENTFVSIVAHGEGWHNFHHAFPWDYRAGEFGKWNAAYYFIKFFSKIGWAYDLKTVSDDVIQERIKRTGNAQM